MPLPPTGNVQTHPARYVLVVGEMRLAVLAAVYLFAFEVVIVGQPHGAVLLPLAHAPGDCCVAGRGMSVGALRSLEDAAPPYALFSPDGWVYGCKRNEDATGRRLE